MEKKKSIFEKIDTVYTKVVKVIIGDLPLKALKPQKDNLSITETTTTQTKYLYQSLKDKFLNLGTPKNENELLYEEVIKKEKAKDTDKKQIQKKEETENTPQNNTTAETTKKTIPKTSNKDQSISVPTTKNEPLNKNNQNTKKTISSIPTTENTSKETKTTQKKAKQTTKNHSSKTQPKPKKEKDINKISNSKEQKKETKKNTITTSSKIKSAPKGAKKAAKIALYIKDIKKHYGEVDENFVAIIVKNLGPSIYKKDAELVSCSDPKELDTVRKNFLKKKLGIEASKGVLDAAIQDVCQELKAARKKYRATFYYALAKKFKKESMLS